VRSFFTRLYVAERGVGAGGTGDQFAGAEIAGVATGGALKELL